MQRLLSLSAIAALVLSATIIAPVTAAPVGGTATCTTDQSPNPRPAAWYSLGKPANYYSDGCFHQFMTNNPDSPVVDVVIVPPAGPLPLRDISLLRQSVDMWEDGLVKGADTMGYGWFADGFEINAFVAGADSALPGYASAVRDPEIVILQTDVVVAGYAGIGTDTVDICHSLPDPFSGADAANDLADLVKAQPGFDDHHPGSGTLSADCGNGQGGRICFVVNNAWLFLPSTGVGHDFYDLQSHEFGHCLGVGHVGDASDFGSKAYPPDDIMSYEQDGWASAFALCVSNLNVKTMAYRYHPLIPGAPANGRPTGVHGGYMTMEGGRDPGTTGISDGPSSWRVVKADGSLGTSAADCPQPDTNVLGSDVLGGGEEEPEREPRLSITSPTSGAEVDAADGLTVQGVAEYVVDTAGGLPNPTGSGIAGSVTIFPAEVPLAYGEVLATATGIPVFTPGEGVELHSRFTKDTQGGVTPGGDPMTWFVWKADGTPVDDVACVTDPDSSAADDDPTTPEVEDPDTTDFDCIASWTMPQEFGRYFTAVRAEDGRFSCHTGEPGVDTGQDLPPCLKPFEVVASLPEAPAAAVAPPGTGNGLIATAGIGIDLGEALARAVVLDRLAIAAPSVGRDTLAVSAPTVAPADAFVTDDAGDVQACSLLNGVPCVPGVPRDDLDLRAAWFDSDADNLYVGVQLQDLPAPSEQIPGYYYNVAFAPDWAELADFCAPAVCSGTDFRLQVSASYSGIGFDFGALPFVGAQDGPVFMLEYSYQSEAGGTFGPIGALPGSMSPTTDIIWWVVPRAMLSDPPAIAKIGSVAVDDGQSISGFATLPLLTDVAAAPAGALYTLSDPTQPLVVDAGAYSGLVDQPISIGASATGGSGARTCLWSAGASGGAFANADSCSTTVTFSAVGTKTISVTMTDSTGSSSDSATVTVGAGGNVERVEVTIGEATSSTPVDPASGPDGWSAVLDIRGLASGTYDLTARWLTAGGQELASATVVGLEVTAACPEAERCGNAGGDLDNEAPVIDVGSLVLVEDLVELNGQAQQLSLQIDVEDPNTVSEDLAGVDPVVTFGLDGEEADGITLGEITTFDVSAKRIRYTVPFTLAATALPGDYSIEVSIEDAGGLSDTASFADALTVIPEGVYHVEFSDGSDGLDFGTFGAEDADVASLNYFTVANFEHEAHEFRFFIEDFDRVGDDVDCAGDALAVPCIRLANNLAIQVDSTPQGDGSFTFTDAASVPFTGAFAKLADVLDGEEIGVRLVIGEIPNAPSGTYSSSFSVLRVD